MDDQDERELKQQQDDDDRKSATGGSHQTTSSTTSSSTSGSRTTFGRSGSGSGGPGGAGSHVRGLSGRAAGGAGRGGIGGIGGGMGGPGMGGLGSAASGGLGYLYVIGFMFLAIVAAATFTAGPAPIDPNGPGGPPTLPPYYQPEGEQRLILPTASNNKKDQLQLKTFLIDTCSQTVAVNFLLDTSGSMREDNKMGKMKAALQAFTTKLKGDSVIGIQTFSDTVQDRVPLDYFKNNKSNINSAIASLYPNGWTSTRDGMTLSKSKLSEAISTKKFPGYKYYMILMTDGVPETPSQSQCLVEVDEGGGDTRCFAIAQDPRTPTNIGKDIKDMDVTIYSIGIYSQGGTDKVLEPYLVALLKDMSSGPQYYFSSPNASNLTTVLDSIFKSICQPLQEKVASPTATRN